MNHHSSNASLNKSFNTWWHSVMSSYCYILRLQMHWGSPASCYRSVRWSVCSLPCVCFVLNQQIFSYFRCQRLTEEIHVHVRLRFRTGSLSLQSMSHSPYEVLCGVMIRHMACTWRVKTAVSLQCAVVFIVCGT